MEKTIITFQADEQNLVKTSGVECYASDTVSYIEAQFTLGTNWTSFDSVRAMWRFGTTVIATVLDANGTCLVPHEVLTKRGELKVNLVGSIAEGDVLTDRLTSFPIKALVISKIAEVEGDETSEVTPSQFEQYVNITNAAASRAEASAEQAEQSALASAQSAQSASESAESASQSAQSASQSAEEAEQASQSVLGLTATASVDSSVGTPSVAVTVSESGDHKVMDFAFSNLKGEQGEQGEHGASGADGFSPIVTVTEDGTDYTIDITDINGSTSATFKAIKTVGNGLVLSPDGNLHIGTVQSWEDLRTFIRAGQAKNVLQIGQQLTFTRDGQTIKASVMDFVEGGRNGGIALKDGRQYGVIFQTEDILYNLQFDAQEAFYCAVDGLPAGDYCFLLGQHSWVAADVGKTFYFTLQNDVPTGGQLVFAQSYNATLEGASIRVYASATSTTISETATMSSTAIAGATNLGELRDNFNDGFNSCQRALLGNNRWKESAMRQHLNSDAVAGSVWTPQNIYDRPPSWASNTKGFMNGLGIDFLPYVSEVEVDTYRNTLCDGGGYDTTDEMFFLAGRKEVYMPSESNADDNEPWEYYIEETGLSAPSTVANDGRVKKNISSGTAYYWWLRSPHVGFATSVRNVSTTGADYDFNAYSSYGVAPAFVIS